MASADRERVVSRQARFVALLCVTGQLAAATHLVLVRHATCPEHGDLLHGEAAHGRHSAAVDRAVAAAFTARAAADGEEDHDHCSVPSERRKQAIAPAPSCVLSDPASSSATCPAPSVPVAAGVELLSLAPKQSPPAV